MRAALDDGSLDPGRWKSFRKLQRELEHQARQADPVAREAHRRKWVTIHKAAKEHMKVKRGEW